MKAKLFLILLVLISVTVYSQDTIYNLVDKDGLKTGFWKSYYPNGGLRYFGYFIKGKPVGKMKRYYIGGLLQAEMNFNQTGTTALVKLYNVQGNLIAEGKYKEKSKDSTWNYYSSYDGRLVMRENYMNGKKEGSSFKYHNNGKTSEILEWVNDIENGKWSQFYENGNLRLNCSNTEGKRSGKFQSFNPDGFLSVTGEYKNGIMNGKWIFYNAKGEEDYFIEYVDGKMLPNKEYDKRVEEFSKSVEEAAKRAGVVPDEFNIAPF